MSRRRTRIRRKIAVATWRPSRDGRIYARMEVDATATLAALAELVAAGRLRVPIGAVYPLEQAPEAFAAFTRGASAAPEPTNRIGPTRSASVPRTPSE